MKKNLVWLAKIGISAAILGYLSYKAWQDHSFDDLVGQPKHWGLLAGAFVAPALAQEGPKSDPGQDFVFLTAARPLLIRVHVRVDGKTLSAAHDDFVAHLFRRLDVKGKGYLTKDEVERLPPMEHILNGGFNRIFGGYSGKATPAFDIQDLLLR